MLVLWSIKYEEQHTTSLLNLHHWFSGATQTDCLAGTMVHLLKSAAPARGSPCRFRNKSLLTTFVFLFDGCKDPTSSLLLPAFLLFCCRFLSCNKCNISCALSVHIKLILV